MMFCVLVSVNWREMRCEPTWQRVLTRISWNYPPPRMPVTSKIILFLVRNPNQNLHLWLASWKGGRPKECQLLELEMSQNWGKLMEQNARCQFLSFQISWFIQGKTDKEMKNTVSPSLCIVRTNYIIYILCIKSFTSVCMYVKRWYTHHYEYGTIEPWKLVFHPRSLVSPSTPNQHLKFQRNFHQNSRKKHDVSCLAIFHKTPTLRKI